MRHFEPLPHERAFDPRPLRVQVCSRQASLRQALRQALDDEKDMRVHAIASSAVEVTRHAGEVLPDIVLLDIRMAGDGWRADLAALMPGAPPTVLPPAVLALSAYFDEEFLYALFAAGAKGYLLIEEWPGAILRQVRRMIWGTPVLSPAVLNSLGPPRPTNATFSRRETLLLRMVARGFTDGEITHHLRVEPRALANALDRLQARLPQSGTRVDLVAWAWRHGCM